MITIKAIYLPLIIFVVSTILTWIINGFSLGEPKNEF